MSETAEWANRLNHEYSHDERSLSFHFTQELQPLVDQFLGDNSRKVYSVGIFDLQKEPWRASVVMEFRKYGLKLLEKQQGDGRSELILKKQKLSMCG